MKGERVARPRLHALLAPRADVPATLISATAGWGKTELAASWVRAGSGGADAAWVRVQAADPVAFWRATAAALLPVAAPEACSALRRVAAEPLGPEEIAGEVESALGLLARRVLLVLDGLHEVSSPSVHRTLTRLIERPVPMLSLLVTTRRDPPWPLARLRLAGLLTEVRAEDLALRPDEVAPLFDALTSPVGPECVAALVERTEGWPACLALAALHLAVQPDAEAAARAFSGAEAGVKQYLTSEILERQPTDTIEFLRSVCVVDTLDAELAELLTGRPNTADVLADLAAADIVVPVTDQGGRRYRLHRLLADVVRDDPLPNIARRNLARQASRWLDHHDLPLEAIGTAARGEVWGLAADLTAKHAIALALGGRATELAQLLAGLPRSALVMHPDLAAGLAAVRAVQGDRSVSPLIDMARATLGQRSGRGATRSRMLVDFAAGFLARLDGDWATAATIYRRLPLDLALLARLPIAHPEIVPVLVATFRGVAALLAGELDTAERHLEAAAAAEFDASALPQLDSAGLRALLRAAAGELTEAQAQALEIIAATADAGPAVAPQLAAAYVTMSAVALDRGAADEAGYWLRRIADLPTVARAAPLLLATDALTAACRLLTEPEGHVLPNLVSAVARLGAWSSLPGLRVRVLSIQARLFARIGDLATARATVEALSSEPGAADTAVVARLWLLLSEPTAAAAARATVAAPDSPRTHVETALLDALLAQAFRDHETALEHIEDALVAAAPFGIRWTFLIDRDQVRPLLQDRLARGTVVPTFASGLLARMSVSSTAAEAPTREQPFALTKRERAILRYLASPLSRDEIASSLHVSVNTVKTHQRAVYRKLGARFRHEAVAKARRLHLL